MELIELKIISTSFHLNYVVESRPNLEEVRKVMHAALQAILDNNADLLKENGNVLTIYCEHQQLSVFHGFKINEVLIKYNTTEDTRIRNHFIFELGEQQ